MKSANIVKNMLNHYLFNNTTKNLLIDFNIEKIKQTKNLYTSLNLYLEYYVIA